MRAEAWSAIATWVYAIGTCGIAVAGLWGLKVWRHELRGTAEYDLARRILRAVYQLRNALEQCRNPLMSSSEWQNRPGREPDQEAATAEDLAYAFERRWSRVSETGALLDTELIEAEVIWGKVLRDAKRAIRECTNDLLIALEQYVAIRRGGPQSREYGAEERQAIRELVYRQGSDDNPDAYGRRLHEAVRKFEAVLKGHLAQ